MYQQPIWIVIPALNESQTIKTVVEKFSVHTHQIIVVNDGSTDDTKALAEEAKAIVLSHDTNLGKAAALMTGFKYALAHDAQAIITVDADDQHDPKHIPELIAASQSHSNAIIIAARFHERQNAPRERYIANRIADFWISWACGQKIWDSQSGYRLYPASLLKKININHEKSHSFVFESEILICASNLNHPIHGIPTAYFFPEQLRQSYFQPSHDIWLITKMVAKDIIKKKLFLNGLWRSLRDKNFFLKK